MVKRILLALVVLPFALCAFAAQPTATLQSGDSFTPFYGQDAFVKAHEAASDGDVITLSPGVFISTDITKSVKVIGTYAFSEKAAESTQFDRVTVIADDVTLEGIRFNVTLTIKAADHLAISRCYMYNLWDEKNGEDKYHDNTILTDCLVLTHHAMEFSQNAVLRNCSIGYFNTINETQYPALIENCNITIIYEANTGTNPTRRIPYAIYRNCALGLYDGRGYSMSGGSISINFTSPSEFHNNTLLLSYYLPSSNSHFYPFSISYNNCVAEGNSTSTYTEITDSSKLPRLSSFIGTDGYGPQNHKEYPAIPKIDSASICTQTDSIGNLKVKIIATARD